MPPATDMRLLAEELLALMLSLLSTAELVLALLCCVPRLRPKAVPVLPALPVRFTFGLEAGVD